MSKLILFLALLQASSAMAQATQPQDHNQIICSTEEAAEKLATMIKNEGLPSKGVEEPTSYCLPDIKILWSACAKSKGVKRRTWCGLLTQYCQEFAKQDELLYQRQLVAYDKGQAAIRAHQQETELQTINPNPYNGDLGAVFQNFANGMNLINNAPKMPIRYGMSGFCTSIPDPEDNRPKTANRAAMPMSSSEFSMPMDSMPIMPMPSPGPVGPSRSFDYTAPKDTSRCYVQKNSCWNACHLTMFGQAPDTARQAACDSGCEADFSRCMSR
jgi:hypothetical protein